MVYEIEDLDKIINDALPDLLLKLKLDILMLARLRRAGVLTESIDDELKTVGLSPHKKIDMFLEDLKIGPIERFLNFCRVIKEESEYHHLLDYLQVDINIVYAQLGVELPTPRLPPPHNLGPAGAAGPNPRVDNNNVCKLWEENHPDGGIFLVDSPDLFDKLVVATPKLKRLLRTKDLWAYLQRHHIMDDLTVEECQVGTRGDHVEAIIKVLKKGEVWRTHAFFRSLAQMDQHGLIDQVLGPGHREVYMENIYERY